MYGNCGPAVLLLHDGTGSSLSLNHRETATLVDWLWQRKCRVVTFDLRGHGQSSRVRQLDQDWYQSSADDARAVLDDLGVDEATVIGVGDGAVVALKLAIRHPQCVTAVVADGARVRLTPALAAGRNPKGKRLSDQWRQLLEQMHGADHVDALMEAYAGLMDRLAADPADHYCGNLGSVRCPVMLLACDDDRFDLPKHGRQLAAMLPDARLQTVGGAGQVLLWSDAAAFRAAVQPFLREHLVGVVA